MKLSTHYVFTAGLLSLVGLVPLGRLDLLVAGFTSVLANILIDKLGHEIKEGYIRRTPLTHTVPRSMLWGVLASTPVALLPLEEHRLATTLFVLLEGALAGLSHMLLDAFTEKGIYVKKNGKWVRFALAHFRYDDPIANGLATVLGVLMLYATVRLI